MRYLVALAFYFLVAPSQVHACRGLFGVQTLFFETIPNPQPDADLIAKVTLSDVNVETKTATATATVMQVLKTSDAKVQQGDKISMKYKFTSCGPDSANGAQGTIIARVGADMEGRLVLYPYMYRRYGDGHITPPSMSE